MIVKILQKNKLVPGDINEHVEVSGDKGNPAACLGYVLVLSHDSAAGLPASEIVNEEPQQEDTNESAE